MIYICIMYIYICICIYICIYIYTYLLLYRKTRRSLVSHIACSTLKFGLKPPICSCLPSTCVCYQPNMIFNPETQCKNSTIHKGKVRLPSNSIHLTQNRSIGKKQGH